MNWITKIIKASEKIKTAIHKRATKEEIAKSDWTSCCKGPILKKDLEENLWVCPDCNKHHRINPKQRFDIFFGKNNYEIFKTPIPKDDPLGWTDSKSYKDRLKNARKKMLVADVSKFAVTANFKICNAKELDYVILNELPPPGFKDILKEHETQLIISKNKNAILN